MSTFTKHTPATAPAASIPTLEKIQERYGFLPNLSAHIAESPSAFAGLLGLIQAFDQTSLTAQEQQIVGLTVSLVHGCSFCRTVHTGLARQAQVDEVTLRALLTFDPLPDLKQNALRDFVRTLVEERGRVSPAKLDAFLAAGYTKAQVFEVVLGISLKVFTNYSNHLANVEPNPEFLAMAEPSLT